MIMHTLTRLIFLRRFLRYSIGFEDVVSHVYAVQIKEVYMYKKDLDQK
jgi:hypothetical protein